MRGKHSARCLLVAFALAVALVPLGSAVGIYAPSSVSAWSGSQSAAYADAHWNDCKSNGSSTFSSDGYLCFGNPPGADNCAAYASEALHAGGYSYVRLSGLDKWYWNLANENQRWITNPNYFISFSNAPELYAFLTYWDHDNHNGTGAGGGWLKRIDVAPGPSLLYNQLGPGDLLFMDFNGSSDSGWISHVRVEIGWYAPGVGPLSPYYWPPDNAYVWQGDYADNQSPGRRHDQWSGFYAYTQAGGNPQDLVVFEVSIDTRNV